MALQPEVAAPKPSGNWFGNHPAGVISALIGSIGLCITLFVQIEGGKVFGTFPNPLLTVPFFAASLIAGVVAVARKEGTYVLPLIGVGAAACAVALGWVIAVAIVVAVAAVVLAVLSELF